MNPCTWKYSEPIAALPLVLEKGFEEAFGRLGVLEDAKHPCYMVA
jgi:hypothetical protein